MNGAEPMRAGDRAGGLGSRRRRSDTNKTGSTHPRLCSGAGLSELVGSSEQGRNGCGHGVSVVAKRPGPAKWSSRGPCPRSRSWAPIWRRNARKWRSPYDQDQAPEARL